MLHKALEQFLADVDCGQPDFLLVDMPPAGASVAHGEKGTKKGGLW